MLGGLAGLALFVIPPDQQDREVSMKLYDISQEVFSCCVYPGDPKPQRQILSATAQGALYNLTALSMCAHNGTHIDAPFHFLGGGKTVDQLGLLPFLGPCQVVYHRGDVTGADAATMLRKTGDARRLLIAGPATVTEEAARVFAQGNLLLIGNESQTLGPENAPMQVHLILLGAGIVLLEGVVLKDVPQGRYFLSAAPLNLAGADGAPCRAVLIDMADESRRNV